MAPAADTEPAPAPSNPKRKLRRMRPRPLQKRKSTPCQRGDAPAEVPKGADSRKKTDDTTRSLPAENSAA